MICALCARDRECDIICPIRDGSPMSIPVCCEDETRLSRKAKANRKTGGPSFSAMLVAEYDARRGAA